MDDDDLPDSAYPIRYHGISKAQKTDAKLNVSEIRLVKDTTRMTDLAMLS